MKNFNFPLLNIDTLENIILKKLKEEDDFNHSKLNIHPNGDINLKNPLADLEKFKNDIITKLSIGYLILKNLYSIQNKLIIPFLEDDFFLENIELLDCLEKGIDDEKNLNETLGISEKSLENAYHLLLPLFDKGQYEEASAALILLNYLYTTCPESLIALGHAEFHCKRFAEASQCYCNAFLCDPTDTAPLIYALDCFNLLGDKDKEEECKAYIENNKQKIREVI